MHTGFIGIGSMGGMLLRSLLRAGALAPDDVWAANRTPRALPARVHAASAAEVAAQCDLIFLCVSAGDTAAALAQMDAALSPRHLLVTTAAAIPLAQLEARVPCRAAKLIPSITQEIGAGIALLMYGARATPEDRTLLETLLGRFSQPVVIDESLARPAISLTSGGPALIAYLLESMAEEAVRANPALKLELAHSLVRETAIATMRLIGQGNMPPPELIRRVAIPGGMTAPSIEILSRHVPKAWREVFEQTAAREAKTRASLTL